MLDRNHPHPLSSVGSYEVWGALAASGLPLQNVLGELRRVGSATT